MAKSPSASLAQSIGTHGSCQILIPLLKPGTSPGIPLVIIKIRREIKVRRFFEHQTVDQFQVPVVRFVTVLRKRHGFATFKELLIALTHLRFGIGRCEIGIEIVRHILIFRLVIQIGRYAARSEKRLGHSGRRPMAMLADMAAFIHVVHIAQQRIPPTVGKPQKETTPQPSVFRSTRSLHIGNISLVVFVFQVYVHHIFARFHIVSQRLTLVRLFFIHFKIFHRIIR